MPTKPPKARPASRSKVVPIGVKRRVASKTIAPFSVRPSITVGDAPFFYANFLEVGHSNHEFTLFAVRVPPKLSDEQKQTTRKTGVLELQADLLVSFSPRNALGLIRALQTQIEAYEKAQGPIQSGDVK